MRIFGIFTFTGLGLMLSVVSIDGSFQDFTLVGIGVTGFALNLLLLFVGIGIGILLEDGGRKYQEYYDKYYRLVEAHDKLTHQRDELRLDAIRNFDKIFSELKKLKNVKR